MLSYNETMLKAITKFLNNIYYAKGRKLDTAYLPMWTREIVETGATEKELNKAEVEIIRNNTPLIISEVCEVIRNNKTIISLPTKKVDCPFCEGVGTVSALAFDTNGKIIDSAPYLLNCYCNKKKGNLQMKYNKNTFHKTYGKDKYFRVFKNIKEQFEYQEKVWANNDMDILQ